MTVPNVSLRFIWGPVIVLMASVTAVSANPSNQELQNAPPDQCPTNVVTLTEQDPEGFTPAQQLMNLLSPWNTFAGTILIPSGMTVVLDVPETPWAPGYTTRWLYVKSCVTIKGSRNGLDPGPLLVATNRVVPGPIFEVLGQYVRIEGLRFRGPMTTDDRSDRDWSVHAIGIAGDASSVHIDNNAFEFWSVGVTVFRGVPMGTSCEDNPALISITRNYFNRNAIEDLGYGVGVLRGCATIAGNLFNKNRHAVGASGDVKDEATGVWHGKGYIARFNYVLEGGFTECSYGGCYWNQHFDAHGTGSGGYGGVAGEYFLIASNTVRGEQTYAIDYTRPAFMLRGKPLTTAEFRDNVVVHDDESEAVRIKRAGPECAVIVNGHEHYPHDRCNLQVSANRYDTDTKNELAVGDFDGDGYDDVFLANGTAWWYSSAGLTEWRFLRPSTLRIADLRFGHFNADARTDVLFSDGANWWVSMGAVWPPTLWRADGTRLLDCVFGDFDNDALTDALWADGSTWRLSSGARGPWVERLDQWLRAASVRVGDFNGNGTDDVFWIANGTWHVWYPDTNRIRTDHRKPVEGIGMNSLVVADFDGDGWADLGRSDGTGRSWLRGRTNVWEPLRDLGGQAEYSNIRAALFGRFTGDTWLDAIRYALPEFSSEFKYGFAIWNGTQDAFTPWTPAWQEMR